MKKIFLLLPLFAIVLLAGCSQPKTPSTPPANPGIKSNISAKLMAGSGDVKDQLLAIVAQNSGADSCFTMISGGVYNLTSILISGDNEMLSFCGKDSTKMFNEKVTIDPNKWGRVQSLQIMF